MKLEPFFILLLTMSHLVSNGSTNVFIHQLIEKKFDAFDHKFLNQTATKKRQQKKMLLYFITVIRKLDFHCTSAQFKLTNGLRWPVLSVIQIVTLATK